MKKMSEFPDCNNPAKKWTENKYLQFKLGDANSNENKVIVRIGEESSIKKNHLHILIDLNDELENFFGEDNTIEVSVIGGGIATQKAKKREIILSGKSIDYGIEQARATSAILIKTAFPLFKITY